MHEYFRPFYTDLVASAYRQLSFPPNACWGSRRPFGSFLADKTCCQMRQSNKHSYMHVRMSYIICVRGSITRICHLPDRVEVSTATHLPGLCRLKQWLVEGYLEVIDDKRLKVENVARVEERQVGKLGHLSDVAAQKIARFFLFLV